jgi:hypothetical protein
MDVFARCPICNKPLVNEANVKIIRLVARGIGAAGLVSGIAFLPILGFGLAGVQAGSLAAALQGPAVAAGSWFAMFQSLGATGMGMVLFGTLGAAIGVLAQFAATIGWCNGCEPAELEE